MSSHISIAEDADIAETVIMPGDPLRAKFIAENFLKEPVLYTDIRNMYGYTGLYKGVPVSVQGSGMGMPSMGIYSWELFQNFNVKRIIRTGTCGSFNKDIRVGDTLFCIASSTDSNYCQMFGLNGTYSPSCSFSLFMKAVSAAEKLGIPVRAGNVLSSDHFYEADPDWWLPWQKMNVLGVEMEAAALYANAAFLGGEALAVLTVSDQFVTGERADNEERQKSFTDMMKIALETAVI